jgi:hypothetical protein
MQIFATFLVFFQPNKCNTYLGEFLLNQHSFETKKSILAPLTGAIVSQLAPAVTVNRPTGS